MSVAEVLDTRHVCVLSRLRAANLCDDCPARDSTVLESVRVPGRGGGGQGGRRSQKTSGFLDFRDQWPRTRQRIRESWQNQTPPRTSRSGHFAEFRPIPGRLGHPLGPAVKPCAANSRRALKGTSARASRRVHTIEVAGVCRRHRRKDERREEDDAEQHRCGASSKIALERWKAMPM